VTITTFCITWFRYGIHSYCAMGTGFTLAVVVFAGLFTEEDVLFSLVVFLFYFIPHAVFAAATAQIPILYAGPK